MPFRVDQRHRAVEPRMRRILDRGKVAIVRVLTHIIDDQQVVLHKCGWAHRQFARTLGETLRIACLGLQPEPGLVAEADIGEPAAGNVGGHGGDVVISRLAGGIHDVVGLQRSDARRIVGGDLDTLIKSAGPDLGNEPIAPFGYRLYHRLAPTIVAHCPASGIHTCRDGRLRDDPPAPD